MTHESALQDREREALAFLVPLSEDYPSIRHWFASKVVPGLAAGTRLLIEVRCDDTLAGLGIAKLEDGERKICTVRVAPGFVGRGIGLRLFDELLRWLDTDKPFLTVNQEKYPVFERIFEWYGFTRTSIRADAYIPGVAEFGFNESDAARFSQG